jgi:hypothetical protein
MRLIGQFIAGELLGEGWSRWTIWPKVGLSLPTLFNGWAKIDIFSSFLSAKINY